MGEVKAATDFPGYLYAEAAGTLRQIGEEPVEDIYVVSFLVFDEDDDPRRPVLTIGTNTESKVRQAMDSGQPSGEAEARWNYAFWLQDRLAEIGDSERDPAGQELRAAWFRRHGLWFEDGDYSDAADEIGDSMTAQFVELCVETVRRLHREGVVEQALGRPVPVLVHELEYYDEIAQQNRRANGPELNAPFEAWIQAMYD